MLCLTLALLCLATASSKDIAKVKSHPSITHSVVNMGKMDINLYMSGLEPPKSQYEYIQPYNAFSYPRTEFEESCPCSSTRTKDLKTPMDFLSKILMSNDLFSKDPLSSSLCCDSHEHYQEDVVIELGSKMNPLQSKSFPLMPFSLDLLPSKPKSQTVPKGKAVDIFLFPEKFNIEPAKSKEVIKKEIKVVGDRETIPLNADKAGNNATVKKDLTVQELASGSPDDVNAKTVKSNRL